MNPIGPLALLVFLVLIFSGIPIAFSMLIVGFLGLWQVLGLAPALVTRPGRYPNTVEARSVLCYWAARELGISTVELSKRLGISQPTASQSVKRGESTVRNRRLELTG